jgi:DeoR/GlpR family transcriptional regulator of sugar metabolism
MTIINRDKRIYWRAKSKGYVNVVDLTETHNVSTVTIRKGLKLLENQKLLHHDASKQPYMLLKRCWWQEALQVEQKKQIALGFKMLW